MGELLNEWRKKKGKSTETAQDTTKANGSLLAEWRESKKYKDVDTSGVNDAYFESYNQAANSFFSSKELQEGSYDQWKALSSQADTIRAWAWQNRNKLGSNYDKIMSATDLSEAGKYWNQFKSAEDYAKEYGSYASYNEMMNADLGALEQEIAEREQRVSELEDMIGGNIFEKSWKSLTTLQGASGDQISALEQERQQANSDLAEKRAYYNEAKNLQAGRKYDESARLDPEFANLAEQGGVIAPSGSRIENWVAYYRDPDTAQSITERAPWSKSALNQLRSYEFTAAQHMTDDEFATYNYLIGKGDIEAAEVYLDSLTYQINQRAATTAATALKGKTVQEVMWAIPTGLNQFGTGVQSALSGALTDTDYITPSALQLSSGMVREDLADDGFKAFGSSAGQLAYDTLNTTANMAPSILASAAVNMVAPGAGAYVGGALMGISAGGNAYAEALNNGYNKENAMAYGLFVGASEAALQSVLGGIGSLAGAGNISEQVLISKANAINNALLRVAAKYGIKIASETAEEELQNYLEPLFAQIFLGKEYDAPTIEELVQTAIVTAISTGMLESVDIVQGEVENKTYKDTYGDVQGDLVAEGLELDPQSAYFKRLNEKIGKGKSLTGGEIRSAVEANEQAIGKLEKAEKESGARSESEPTAAEEEASSKAAKIDFERVKIGQAQTVAKTEKTPGIKQAAEAKASTEQPVEEQDVQQELTVASKRFGAQAKAMVATYIDGQSVKDYSNAFGTVYDMGAAGVKYEYVQGMDSYLTESQRKIAYEAGKAAQEAKAERSEKRIAKKATGGTERKKGVVRGDGVSIEELSAKFNDTQKNAYKIFSFYAEVTGIDIVLYKSEADARGNFTDAQGKYDRSTPGVLYIDVNAGLNNIKSAGDLSNYTMLRTFSHEFVHFIENYNPVWYNDLRRAVFEHLENADELISREAAATGLSYEMASREVVAEALTEVLPDSAFLENLANENKSLFDKLLAKIKEFVASIKAHFASLAPNTNRAANDLKQSVAYMEEIVKLFDKAALGAVQNYQATVAEQKVEADGNVIEMAKAEAQKIDQEKPKKATKPKKIASTEAVIPEESADTSKIEQESAKSDVTVEQAKQNLKKAITMPIQGTNEEALLAGIISKELTFDMVSYHGNFPGFSPVQRAHLVQKLIEGVYTDDKVIKIDVPYDGKFEINNTPENVANVLNALKVRVPQEIVWDKKAFTHFKNEGRVAVMKHGGQDYITDGGLMLPITDAAARIATKDLRAEFREYPEGFDEIVANATVPVKNAPYEAEIKGRTVYVFDIGGEKVYFDKKRFAFIDGGVLTYAKGEKFSVIKSVNADGSLIGYLLNVRSPKTDIEDGKPTKLKSFSKKKGAKGEVQYQSRAYTEQDQAYMDAVESGDMETAQRMVDDVASTMLPDSKIRTDDGKLRIVYHGTNTGDFTVFNPDYIGMSSGDDGFFGMGFYFAYSKGEASYYGSSRVIPAYLNLKNPFDFQKELQTYKGKRASGGYAPDAVALMNFADKFPEIAKNVKIGVVENGSDTGKDITLVEFSKAFKDVIENKTFEYSVVANEFGEKETVVTADAKTVEYEYGGEKHSYKDYGFQKRFWGTPNELDVAYEYLANSVYEYVDMIPRTRLILDNNREFTAALKDMGYDGAIQSEYGDEAVAFYPNQIKSADAVTYDDDGNVIPLSERFDEAQEDIRYQRRANYAPGLTSGKPGEGMSYEVSIKDYTLKEVVNMYHLGNLGAEYDALFDKVFAFCANANVAFRVEPVVINDQGTEVPGKHGKGVVTLSQKHFNSKAYTDEQKSRVILHEMLHAATTYAMINYYKIRKGDATVNMPKNIYDSCMEINRVFNAIKQDKKFEGMYGKKDSLEMISELSNPVFVGKLKDTYPSNWHMLLQAICNILGINKSFTNYDKLLKAVDEILTHPDYQLARDYFVGDGKTTHYLEESQYADEDVKEQLTLEDTDASYMAALEDGDTETLQRMVEKAAREAGFDSPKLYHGTNTFGFTSIDTKKSNDRVSFFATDSLETAGTYSGTNRVREIGEQSASSLGIYQFYANTEGMLELDAEGSESNHVKLDGIEKKFNDFMMTKSWKTHATAKQLAKYAKQSGYSGVIIKNVIDTATPESRSAANTSTVYIFFDPQKQLASADTVTYDDDGNVVPLSERFSSESKDIRYQRRDGRMTDQEVLAYAVDMYESDPSSMALSDAEKNALELFKERLAKLDDLIAKRYEQGVIYRENTFQTGGDRAKAQEAHNRMEVLDGQIARASAQLLDVKQKAVLQGILQKARLVIQSEERERGAQRLNRWREIQEERARIRKYRDRILADREELIKWLEHPMEKNVTKHVNENVKATVIGFLLSIDVSSKSRLRGDAATKADEKHAKQAQKLLNMLNGLEDEVRYSGEYDLPLNFTSRLEKHIRTVETLIEDYEGELVINRMTADELQELSLLVTNLKVALSTMNKFHTNAMFSHVSVAAEDTVRYLRRLEDRDGNRVDNFITWKNMRPAYVWERFGDGGKAVYEGLRSGQAQLAWNAKTVVDFAENTFTKKEREEWENQTVKVKLSYDREIELTVAALMSFYALSKRKQGREHILNGGVTVSDVDIRESGKKRRVKGRYGKLSVEDIDTMNAKLTDRQKDVADKLQKFMEKQGGAWGNHVTLARFGEKAFGEVGYFPISVDKQSLSAKADSAMQGADLYRLLNMGFTKELSSNTAQPLMLYSVFDVFSTHMADMAQYNAMALPVLDALRWFNYKNIDLETGAENSNLRYELRRAFGAPVVQGKQSSGYAESFVMHILQAYNGTEAQGTPGDSLGMKMLHTYNRAQIAFNTRVVVQQPLALTRATMLIEPKYIAKAINPKTIKASIEDMLEHSGIAVWKDLGYYDINISRGLTQMIKQESTFTENVTEIGLKPAEMADKATWAVMWSACKMQLADRGITDYDSINHLFDDVIYKTQVVDSVLTKSEYMRDKGFFARSTASFMSEPVTSASMLIDAFDKYREDLRMGYTARDAWNKNKRYIGKTAIVYSVGAIMLAAVTAAVDALRDDDDYESLPEKWNEAFWGNLIDELSPLGKLPLLSTIGELIKVGLDIFTNAAVYGNAPEAAWAQWFDSLSKAWEITMDLVNGETNYTWYAAIYKYLQVASGLSGLPLAPITREIVTSWNNVVGAFAPSLKIKSYELKEESEIRYALQDGYLTKEQAADKLLEQGIVYDREQAELTAEAWEFISEHPEYQDMTVSAYALYRENCKGIDVGYFYQAWKYYNQAEADRDKDGNPISGSKKRKVLDYIYQMPISAQEKKRLIKCFYK